MRVTTNPDGSRLVHRTIELPGNRRQHITNAARFLGVSGEQFIQEAIITHLQRTYERMTEDLTV